VSGADRLGGPSTHGNVTRGTRGINRTVGVADVPGLITKGDIEQLSAACVQEEPPACTAACPLHVDVRAVLTRAAAGDWATALATLRATLPFPGVIGRICQQPCRSACRRGEAGDPLAVAAVEQACAEFGGPGAPPARLPGRRQVVAVVGGGLSGAAAAFDLARRGYGVVLLEAADRLGGRLRDLPEALLPQGLVDAELGSVADLGVQLRLGTAVDPADFDRVCTDHDAVVVATGVAGQDFGLDRDPGTGGVRVHPVTGATGRAGVFAAGGVCRAGENPSGVESIAHGRRAAISIDRFVQGVSLTGARDGESSRTTCLVTNTQGVAAARVVPPADPVVGYTAAEAAAEAARCLRCSCLECVKACAFLEHYGSYPKLYARRVLHNMMMVKGNHTANKLINSCSLCGLCAEVCPTGVDMGAMLKRVRQRMVLQDLMPPSAHDFALRDMEFSNGEAFALARPPAGAQACRYAFFPGCQLPGSAPDDVHRVYGYLQDTLGDLGLMLRCCGAPADWAGRSDLADAAWAQFDEQYAALGSPTLIMPCTSCVRQFAEHRPDVPVRSLWTVLDEHELPPDARPASPGRVVSVHDPCTARNDRAVQDSVRNLLSRLGYQVEELPHSRERTECCSYGGLMWLANREIAEQTVRRRIAQSPRDYLTYCVMCRDLFAARGKRSLHLLDLLGTGDTGARATRPGPGWAQRHDNRARLKQTMLSTVWNEDLDEPAGSALIRLRVGDDVRAAMEDRLILTEDVRRVIRHAEQTGEVLVDRGTGHRLARFRPRGVTYWVEYTHDGDEYVVHRAYSHRVQVIGDAHHDR
jgi:glutamate synthase (NADPH/NADH) small chain